jgi:hypothetical protein
LVFAGTFFLIKKCFTGAVFAFWRKSFLFKVCGLD